MRLLGYSRCPACHRPFNSAPVFREDESYCCLYCADGRLCACMTEADLADDGVDGLGLLFRPEARPAHVDWRDLVGADRSEAIDRP